jgi:hypothetical protein
MMVKKEKKEGDDAKPFRKKKQEFLRCSCTYAQDVCAVPVREHHHIMPCTATQLTQEELSKLAAGMAGIEPIKPAIDDPVSCMPND